MPTVKINGQQLTEGLRFFFYSNEGPRMHVHAARGDGEEDAKIWLDDNSVAYNEGLSRADLKRAQRVARDFRDQIERAWHEHFG